MSAMSAGSFESRCGQQVFASTGQYRNMVVRIKELVLNKRKDCVSREVMKEMRLLRELRHDNVNSFIGACIEPTRVLIVTDYCAKGSLYVSISAQIYIIFMLIKITFPSQILMKCKKIEIFKHLKYHD
jgi:Protein tyrosine and serine/threonine kinase